jgi:hypothetical protein
MVRVGISADDQKPHPARLRLIRSGQVIGQIEGQTPLQYEMADREAPAGEWLTYRVEVVSKNGELLTNPIYVAPMKDMKVVGRQQSAAGLRTFDQKLIPET